MDDYEHDVPGQGTRTSGGDFDLPSVELAEFIEWMARKWERLGRPWWLTLRFPLWPPLTRALSAAHSPTLKSYLRRGAWVSSFVPSILLLAVFAAVGVAWARATEIAHREAEVRSLEQTTVRLRNDSSRLRVTVDRTQSQLQVAADARFQTESRLLTDCGTQIAAVREVALASMAECRPPIRAAGTARVNEAVDQATDRARRQFIANLDSGCTNNDFGSCHTLGLIYHGGDGVPADSNRALRYLDRSCPRGYVRSCSLQ